MRERRPAEHHPGDRAHRRCWSSNSLQDRVVETGPRVTAAVAGDRLKSPLYGPVATVLRVAEDDD